MFWLRESKEFWRRNAVKQHGQLNKRNLWNIPSLPFHHFPSIQTSPKRKDRGKDITRHLSRCPAGLGCSSWGPGASSASMSTVLRWGRAFMPWLPSGRTTIILLSARPPLLPTLPTPIPIKLRPFRFPRLPLPPHPLQSFGTGWGRPGEALGPRMIWRPTSISSGWSHRAGWTRLLSWRPLHPPFLLPPPLPHWRNRPLRRMPPWMLPALHCRCHPKKNDRRSYKTLQSEQTQELKSLKIHGFLRRELEREGRTRGVCWNAQWGEGAAQELSLRETLAFFQ